ncbi:hypothetical protein cce_0431 [Crocosphaera subtropica ATCC 51142]|uniref:Uncharacterized protein n=1 Tax=Crocosphaera subtropica (strain ATCC 51142 / BH68) TaxID=43989 RepID=B1WNE0_CROS5|nr:hypothetical protein cce_0431 [Crocosphaera subtropica ATCC 51142]
MVRGHQVKGTSGVIITYSILSPDNTPVQGLTSSSKASHH